MLVEAPVFRRQYGLDQVVGEVFQRDRIVVLDAAAADFVAVAVEERDGELGFLQPVVVRGLAEGGNRQRRHGDEPAHPQRGGFRGGLVEPDRKSTRLNSSHLGISYAVFCLKKKTTTQT